MALPADDKLRKMIRPFQGFIKYFPDAIALVSLLSKVANDQHNPGQPMHWAKEKSTEELDSLANHLADIGSKGELSQDADGMLDAIKVAWRGMANLQRLVDKYGMDELIHLCRVPVDVDTAPHPEQKDDCPAWRNDGSSAEFKAFVDSKSQADYLARLNRDWDNVAHAVKSVNKPEQQARS